MLFVYVFNYRCIYNIANILGALIDTFLWDYIREKNFWVSSKIRVGASSCEKGLLLGERF